MYRYLSIDIGHRNPDQGDPNGLKPAAVDSCLASFFNAEDREVNCEKCKEGKIAKQSMRIVSFPKVMLLHLKRFIVVEKLVSERNDTRGNTPSMAVALKKNKGTC